ncbi:MAG: ABC transporter permease, partial [Hyphomicrobium sp.]
MTLRELRMGISGFYIFIACLALGVFVISGVGSLSGSLKEGFERQGKLILGGDVTLTRYHTQASQTERELIDTIGRVSQTATLRTIGRRLDGRDQTLVELKAVDDLYPLVGELKIKAPDKPQAILGKGLIVDPMLLQRLSLKVGDRLQIGRGDFLVAAELQSEPDGLADRVAYGPRVFLSLKQLGETGLVEPGALIRWRYALLLPESSTTPYDALKSIREDIRNKLPESGFVVTDRRDPSPQVTRTLERLRQFLTLLGLTALITGGVGVANAVSAYIERQRKIIATYKSLGARQGLIFSLFLSFVLALALIGIVIGLFFGFFVPPVVGLLGAGFLPLVPEFYFSFETIFRPLLFGVLVALLFALWPLGRAAQVSPRVLFREDVESHPVRPNRGILVLMGGAIVSLLSFMLLTSDSPKMVLNFVLALTLSLFLFWFIAEAIRRIAQRFSRPSVPEFALALANLAAPSGLIRSVVLSLGLGLTVLVAVGLVDSSFEEELKSRLPETSPNYFVIDITRRDQNAFERKVREIFPEAKMELAPMLRGRIVAFKNTPVEELKAPPDAEWVLTGDRGLTYSEEVPAGSTVVMGSWWKPDYSGEPLVSFEANLARSFDLKIGDTITVNIQGRNVVARIASLRDVKWESLALNFVMVFSPNTLQGAPHNLLATVTLPKDTTLEEEVRLQRVLAQTFSSITTIRVKEAIEAFNKVFLKIMMAVRVAGSVTIVAGALVLAGAISTAHRRRILEAVILKSLGATRWRILTAHALEYLLLALTTSVVAIGIGSVVAYIIVTYFMEFVFAFSWTAVSLSFLVALLLVLSFGFIGTWRVLGARPMPYLQSQ